MGFKSASVMNATPASLMSMHTPSSHFSPSAVWLMIRTRNGKVVRSYPRPSARSLRRPLPNRGKPSMLFGPLISTPSRKIVGINSRFYVSLSPLAQTCSSGRFVRRIQSCSVGSNVEEPLVFHKLDRCYNRDNQINARQKHSRQFLHGVRHETLRTRWPV